MNNNPQSIPAKPKEPDFLQRPPQSKDLHFLDVAPPGKTSQSFLDVAPSPVGRDILQNIQPELPERGFATAQAQSTNVYGKGFDELSKNQQQRKAFELGVQRFKGDISDEQYLSGLRRLPAFDPSLGGELTKGIGRGVVNLPRYAAEIMASFHPDPLQRMHAETIADALSEANQSDILRMNEQVAATDAEGLIENPALLPAWLAAHGGEALPTMAPGIGALKVLGPVSKAGQLGTLFLGSAPIEVGAQLSDLRQTVEQQGRDATPGEKALAVASGLLSAGVEAVGEGFLYNKLIKSLSRSGLDETAQEAIKQEIGATLTSGITSAMKGGGTEMTTEGLQNTISQIGAKYGWDPDRNILEGLPESMAIGGVVGATVRGVSDVAAGKIRQQQFNQLRDLAAQIGIPEDQLMEIVGEESQTTGTAPAEGQADPGTIVQPVEFSWDDTASPAEQLEQLTREERRIFDDRQRAEAANQDVTDYDLALDQIADIKQGLQPEQASQEPVTQPEQLREGLTQDALDFLSVIEQPPAFVSGRLRRIAAENGIEVTEQTTAEEIVNQLRQKADQQFRQQPERENRVIGAVIELPGGERFVGPTHSEAVRKAMEAGFENAPDVANLNLFLTDDGTIISRIEALGDPEQADDLINNRAVQPQESVRRLRESGIVPEDDIAGQLTEEGLGRLGGEQVEAAETEALPVEAEPQEDDYILQKAREDFERYGVATKNYQDTIKAIRKNIGEEEASRYEAEVNMLIDEAIKERQEAEGQPPAAPAPTEEASETSEEAGNFKLMQLKDVQTDPDRFQNRDTDFSEETASSIVRDVEQGKLNPFNLPPIKVWRDPDDGNLYVVGGHSRYEAFQRLGLPSVPVQELQGMTEEEAIEQGRLDNIQGTQETIPEQANIVRDWMDSGMSKTEINERAGQLFKNNSRLVQAFAALDPNGKAIQTYRALQGNQSGDRAEAEKFAKWVGETRLRYPQLTNQHEKELYDYLLSNSNKNTQNQRNFVGFAGELVERNTLMGQFDASKPLNIKKVKPKTEIELESEQQIKDAEKELRTAQKALEGKIREIETRRSKDEDISEERAEEVLKKFQDDVRLAQRTLLQARQRSQKAKSATRTQPSLFESQEQILRSNQIPEEAMRLVDEYIDEDGTINYNKLWQDKLSEDQDKSFFTVFPGNLTEEQYQELKNEVRQQATGQRPTEKGQPTAEDEADSPEELSGQVSQGRGRNQPEQKPGSPTRSTSGVEDYGIPEPKQGKQGQRPSLVYATRDKIPAPQERVIQDTYPILDEHQRFGINMILQRFDDGGEGFLLADGTGTGKTMQILAVADQLQKQGKGKVLIITENQQIIDNNFTDDAKLLGIDLSSIETGTYRNLSDGKIGKDSYYAVLFDEAHNMKNREAKKTIASKGVEAQHRLFATATPMDTLEGITYFAGTVTNQEPEVIYRKLGFEKKMRRTENGTEIPGSEYYVLSEGVSPEQAKHNVLRLRDEMIESGGMLRREFPHFGEIGELPTPISNLGRSREERIDEYWQDEVEAARNESGYIHPKKKMSLLGQRSGELSRTNEADKIDFMEQQIKKSIADGMHVVVVAEGINPTEIKGLDETVPGFHGEMIKRLDAAGIEYAQIFGDADKAAEVRKFQEGNVQVALATPQSGGTGINLDDTVGDSPRVLYMVTANYSGNQFDQILGRVSRRNTASPADVYVMYNDGMSDQRRREIVSKKIKTLKAIQQGQIDDDIDIVAEPAPPGGDINLEEINNSLAGTDIQAETYGKTVMFTGNTKPIKDRLKDLGGLWHRKKQGWMFPQSKPDLVKQVVNEILQTQQPPSTPSRFSSTGGYSEDISEPGTNPVAELKHVEVEVIDGDRTRTVTLGQLDQINAIEMPELVRLVRGLTGTVPTVSTRMKTSRGIFYPVGEGKIRLKKEIFQDPVLATKVLAHEIGHLIDYLPEETMSRGNLLGRLKSLRTYLKQTAEGSESTGKALTQKDRRQLHNRAKKAIIKESGVTLSEYIDNPQLQKQLREKISERYQEYVQQEIKDRKLLSNKIIFNELYAHSKKWRPFDEQKISDQQMQYRRSSEELYADALSALLVSPGTLERNAPTFYNEFFKQLDQKPDVKKIYLETQAFLNGGEEAVLALRDEEIGMMDVKAEQKMKELIEQRKSARRGIDDIKQRFIDRFHPILKAARNAVKAGKLTKDDYNSLQYLIEEMEFRNNDVALFVHDVGEQVLKLVENAGMTTTDVHKYLLLNRIANERLEINAESAEQQNFKQMTDKALAEEAQAWGRAVLANPRGLTADVARRQLDFMKKKLGADKFTLLEQAVRRFQELNFEVVKLANQAGIISDELFTNIIEPNKYNYATFRVIDYIEYPNWMSAAIHQQKGTFKDVSNTFDSTMLKSIAQVKLVRINAAKARLRDMWTDLFPEEFSRAKQTSPGRWKKVADREHLFIFEDGKRVAYNADPYLVKAFDFMDPAMSNVLLRMLNWTNNSIYRPMFITYNPSFIGYSNVIRDVKRLYKNLPQSSVRKIITNYVKSWRDAREYAKGKIDNPRVRALIEEAAIVPPSEAWVLGNREDGFARQAKKYHLSSDKNWADKLGDKYAAFKFIPKFLGWMREMGTTLEILPKLSSERILEGVEGMSRSEKAYIIRNRVGTPNWKKGGTSKRTMNTLFMFSNIMIQGYKSDMEVAADPKTRGAFWFRTLMIDVMPKVMMSAAMAGLFGDELKEFYEKTTEYDKTNYIPIPLGWQDGGDTGRQAVYLRIPQDETGRLISASIYKLMETLRSENEQDYSQIFDLYSDELPTLSPALNTSLKWMEFLSGENPQDDWRDRPILPSRVDKARRVNALPAIKKMVEWSINQTGVTNFATFNPGSKTWNEMVLQTTPILNRAIKVTDYGQTERQWSKTELEEARKSDIRLSYGDEVLNIVSQAYYLRRLGDKRTIEQTRKYMLANGFYQQVYLRLDEAIRAAKARGDQKSIDNLKGILTKQAANFKQMIEETPDDTR